MPGIHTPQLYHNRPSTCRLPGSTVRPGQVSLRSAANKRKTNFLEPLSITPCYLHHSRCCRCQASDSNGKPGMLFGLKNPFRGLRFGKQGNDSEKSQAEQEESQQKPAAKKAQPFGNSMPWRAWTKHFDAMDDLGQKVQEFESALGLATALEKYDQAAELKKEVDLLNANDVVEQVLEGYNTALQEEDYAEAARLRDQGAAGLTGWWVADNQDDPKGHLLRISTGFGRYVGYAYNPQDLAQAEGLPTDEGPPMIHQMEELQPCSIDDVGTPVLELFLKKDASGDMQQQGTVLSIPPELLSQAQSNMAQITDLTADKMWVNEDRDANGDPTISISLTLPTRPNPPSASRPSGSSGSWVGKLSGSGQAIDGSEVGTAVQMPLHDTIDLERTPATIVQTGRDQLEVTVHPKSLTQSVNQEWGSEDTDDSDSDEDAASDVDNSDNPFATMISVSTDEDTDTEPEVDRSLMYHKLYPGRIVQPSDLAEEKRRVAAILKEEFPGGLDAVSGTRIVHEDSSVEFQITDAAMASTSGSDEAEEPSVQNAQEEDQEKKPSWETVVGNVLQVVQQLKQFAPEPGESKEERQKHAELMQKLDEAEKSLTPTQSQATPPPIPQTQPKPKRPITEVMEELRKAQGNGKSMEVPVDANGNNIQDIMKELIGNVVQEAMPQLMQQMGTADSNPIMQVSPGEGENSLKTMRYRRLNTDFVSTDPFTGLYLAAFGSHGPEVLQLRREPDIVDETIEWVIGTKLTGDSNVPAGEVSFKAKIGRGGRLGTPDMYPPDMGVIARYKGSGCVAQDGFQQPTWVDGELLHFSGDGVTTRGAELGFVWTGNHNHFLIVLKRIDLSEQDE